MPPRLRRYYGAGYLHFITTSCYRRQPLLRNPRDRDLFLSVLEQVRRRYRFVLVGYVVMPEHIHLLVSEPERANPSVVMQALSKASPAVFFAAGAPDTTIDRRVSGTPPSPTATSGNAVFTISSSRPSTNESRSCATCTETR
jgi:REP element-mobilizing transposase RayT